MKYFILFLLLLTIVGSVNAGYQYSVMYNVSNQTDGYFANVTANQNWADLRNAPDGTYSITSTYVYGDRYNSGTSSDKWSGMYRPFWIFGGTEDMPDNATNISATLSVYRNYRLAELDNWDIAPVKFRYDGALSDDDYAKFDFINQSPYINTSTLGSNAWLNIALTNTTTINVTGPSAFGMLSKFQIDNTAPSWISGKTNRVDFRTADNMTPIENATLLVTYDTPGITTAYPMRFINDTRILPGSSTGRPPAGTALTINSTPGEITQGGVVISTTTKDTFDMSANATIFTNETGGTLGTSAVNITTVKVWNQNPNNYTYVNYAATANWAQTPELLLHNDSLIRSDLVAQTNEIWVENHSAHPFSGYVHIDNTSVGQWMSDYQIFDNASSNGMPIPFTLLANQNKEIRITSKVPSGTPAGNYTGKLWFNSSNTTPLGVDVTLRVLPFSLVNNTIHHGVMNSGSLDSSLIPGRYVVSQANYTALMISLKEHGLLYTPIETGTTGWGATTETMATIRDTLDFPKDAVYLRGYLFVADSIAANISEANMATRVTQVQDAYAAANTTHGIVDVIFFGLDEGTQEQYIYAKPIYENITANNGKVWATANRNMTHLGSLLAVDVSTSVGSSPYTPAVDGMWLNLSQRNYTHERGLKAFSYSNPQVGIEYPETYRKHYGYGLQKWGFDGVQNFQWYWANLPISAGNTSWNEYQFRTGTGYSYYKPGGYVYPKFDGYVDTLSYEGYREATNDQRYADTLTALTGSNRTALDTISAGIKDGQDMQEIRYNMTDLILTEIAASGTGGSLGPIIWDWKCPQGNVCLGPIILWAPEAMWAAS